MAQYRTWTTQQSCDGAYDDTEVITLTEDEILDDWYDYWESRMIKQFGPVGSSYWPKPYHPQMTLEQWALVDWIVEHGAWLTEDMNDDGA